MGASRLLASLGLGHVYAAVKRRYKDGMSQTNAAPEIFATKADVEKLDGKIENLRVSMKADMTEMRAYINVSISSLRSETHELISNLRSDMREGFAAAKVATADVRSEVTRLETRLMRWIVSGLILNGVSACAAVIKLFLH
jgi:hypothetical protein